VEDGEDPEELFQVAFLGLQRSTRRFSLESGHRFLVYATYWMWQAITRWRADEGGLIRIPVHRFERLAKIDPVLDKLDIWFDKKISDDYLAKELEWTTDEVRQIRSIPRRPESPQNDDEWDLLIIDHDNVDLVDQMQTEKIVKDAIALLPERQAEVIRMRFGIDRDSAMTLEEVGQLYGVTRERIRQIEAKALKLLGHPTKLGKLAFLLER
jgi:RNA polymerase primary sigma factor